MLVGAKKGTIRTKERGDTISGATGKDTKLVFLKTIVANFRNVAREKKTGGERKGKVLWIGRIA